MTHTTTSASNDTTRHERLALRLPLQLFLVAGWLRSGVEKVIDPEWWGGHTVVRFLDESQTLALPFFSSFADVVLIPLAGAVALFVLVLEFGIAAALLTNRLLKPALGAGIFLNVFFTMAGAVNPSAFYIVMQIALLFTVSKPIALEVARRRAALWCLPAVLMLPLARTVDPAEARADPALMLSFVAAVVAATTLAAARPAFNPSHAFGGLRHHVPTFAGWIRLVQAKKQHSADVGEPERLIGRAL